MRRSSCRSELDQVQIASPCTVPWATMAGDDRVRFCGRCRQNVYNVEALDPFEAHRLVVLREGRVCLRLRRRPDGTVVTADCWSRLRAARRRGVASFLVMLVVVGWWQLCAMWAGARSLSRLVSAALPRPHASAPPTPAPRRSPLVSPPEYTMGTREPGPDEPEEPEEEADGRAGLEELTIELGQVKTHRR